MPPASRPTRIVAIDFKWGGKHSWSKKLTKGFLSEWQKTFTAHEKLRGRIVEDSLNVEDRFIRVEFQELRSPFFLLRFFLKPRWITPKGLGCVTSDASFVDIVIDTWKKSYPDSEMLLFSTRLDKFRRRKKHDSFGI